GAATPASARTATHARRRGAALHRRDAARCPRKPDRGGAHPRDQPQGVVGEAQTLRAGLDAVLAVVLAPACAACEQSLDQPTRGPVCPRCWRSILPLTPPLCDGCGDPLPTWRTISVPLARCPRCRRTSRFVDRARSVGRYEGALRSIVHSLKYEGRRSLAGPLAAL